MVKGISIAARKSKGRNLQKYVRDKILEYFPDLKPDDVRSCSMGGFGEDIQLSTKAREFLPYSFECKSNAKIAVYKFYAQAVHNAKDYEPIVVIKQNHSEPLAIIDLDALLDLIKLSERKDV